MIDRYISTLGAVALLAAVGTPVFADESETPKELEAYDITGQTETCLNLTDIRRTRVLDDQHILFILGSDRTYLSKLPYKCQQLGFNEAFSYSTSLSKLCDKDLITVFDTASGSPLSTCGLGTFEKIEKKTSAE